MVLLPKSRMQASQLLQAVQYWSGFYLMGLLCFLNIIKILHSQNKEKAAEGKH